MALASCARPGGPDPGVGFASVLADASRRSIACCIASPCERFGFFDEISNRLLIRAADAWSLTSQLETTSERACQHR